MKGTRLVILGLILMIGFAGLAAWADEDTKTQRVTLELKDTPIRSALEYLFNGTGMDFVVAQDVTGNVSSISLRGVTFEVALRTLLKAVDPPLVYRKDGDVYLISVKKEVPAATEIEAQPIESEPAVLSDDYRVEKMNLNFLDSYDLRTFMEGGDISNNPFGSGGNGGNGPFNQQGGYGPYGPNNRQPGGYYPGGGTGYDPNRPGGRPGEGLPPGYYGSPSPTRGGF